MAAQTAVQIGEAAVGDLYIRWRFKVVVKNLDFAAR